ncbi:uncharacterized protein BDCG_07082 [Blastomyces dermatitidis ER-3]|uniref:Uncharacterized protein n=1 Tax=Ajellomyces dermatitidis (strain ER-3 / ATCC MYA-2586) TaxID=559297 RepID=A0ABM9YIK7_AJEDR|nr:uncharacterized protein BDCG_07082 [Blastomyces dermatitidis ER-3]EEQ91962.2 hypothetical protein BDCG_07082 [Blastomyces dermatitidis ER-3]
MWDGGCHAKPNDQRCYQGLDCVEGMGNLCRSPGRGHLNPWKRCFTARSLFCSNTGCSSTLVRTRIHARRKFAAIVSCEGRDYYYHTKSRTMRMTIIARTKNFSVEVEHTVQRSTVASLRGAPVKSSSFEIMPTASAPVLQLLKRGDSYFVSAGTGKLLPASLPDLMSSWAGAAMAFEAGYIRDVMRYIRLYPFSNGHLHITGEKTDFPCTVTLSFSGSHTHSITIPSEALNTWPGRIIRWENKRLSSGWECTCDWKIGSAVIMSFVIGLWTDMWRLHSLASANNEKELLFPEDQGPESFSYDLMASMDDRSRHEKHKARAWKDRMAWERWGVRPQDVVRYRVSYFKSILLADGTIEMDDNEKADIPGSRQRYCIFVGFEMKPREGLMVLRFLVSSEDGLKPWTKLAPHNYTLRDLGIRLDESSGSTSPTTEFEDD